MQSGNQLGIYLRKDRATVVCLASQGRDEKLLDCFSVAAEGDSRAAGSGDRIVDACRERKIHFTEAAVALDCASFMQHAVHSEFSDPKKIAATVRFDTEETLATDISEVAVSFRVALRRRRGRISTSSRPSGRCCRTSSCRCRATGSTRWPSTPMSAACPGIWSSTPRRRSRRSRARCTRCSRTAGATWSWCRERGQASVLRTFLIGSAQERTAVLAREMLVTTALGGSGSSGEASSVRLRRRGMAFARSPCRKGRGCQSARAIWPALAGVKSGDDHRCRQCGGLCPRLRGGPGAGGEGQQRQSPQRPHAVSRQEDAGCRRPCGS